MHPITFEIIFDVLKYLNMILACPKMPGISLNITNVHVPKSLKHNLPDFKSPESAIWRQALHFILNSRVQLFKSPNWEVLLLARMVMRKG